jgi:hypothetical protein
MQLLRCDSLFPQNGGTILPEEGKIGNEGVQVNHKKPLFPSANGFGHKDVVAGNLYGDIGGEWGGASFEVAEVAVKRRKGRAGANDAKVDSDAAGLAEKILRGIHQFAAQAGALTRRVDTEQAQVASVATTFDIDAASKPHGIFGEKEFSFSHEGANAFGVDTVSFDERQFDAERGVNQADEGFDIAELRRSKPQ